MASGLILAVYMWLFVHRPFEVWPWLGDLQIERMYMLLMVVYWAVQPNKGWVPNRLHVALVFFTLVSRRPGPASPFMNSPGCPDTVENYYKVIVFYVLVVSSVRDEASLRTLLILFLTAVGLYMSHSLLEYVNGRCMWRMGIRRMVGVDTSFMDPNAFAAGLVVALPMTLPLWATKPSPWMRTLLIGFTAVACLCILLTGSRTGLLALGLYTVLCLVSTGRVKTAAALLLLAAVAAPVAWFALPVELQDRYLTIIDPSYGPKNAEESLEGRVDNIAAGYEAWSRSPLLGQGPGSFMLATGRDIKSHNLYVQTFSELGLLGAAALAGLVGCYVLNAREARRFYRKHPDQPRGVAYHVTRSVMIGMVLLLFAGSRGTTCSATTGTGTRASRSSPCTVSAADTPWRTKPRKRSTRRWPRPGRDPDSWLG